jgi:hypothetical protein
MTKPVQVGATMTKPVQVGAMMTRRVQGGAMMTRRVQGGGTMTRPVQVGWDDVESCDENATSSVRKKSINAQAQDADQ